MKRNIKTKLGLIIIMVLTTLSLVGCGGNKETPTEAAGIFKPGTYSATTESFRGELKIETEFDKDKIIAIKIVENNDTPGLSDDAFTAVIEKILESQSAEVEAVTGATYSSKALMVAVQDTIDQAKN